MMAFCDVAIFIASKSIQNAISFNRINSRLLMQILIDECMLNIFSDYAPQTGLPLEDKILLYDQLL